MMRRVDFRRDSSYNRSPMTKGPAVKFPLILLVTAMIFLFAGCFEISEEIWFNNDGSGRLRYDFGVAQALIDAAAPGRASLYFNEFRARFSEHPDVRKFASQEYKESGIHHWVFDIEVTDTRILADILNSLMRQQVTMMGDSTDASDVSIERLGSGGTRFLQSFERYTRRHARGDTALTPGDSSGIKERLLEQAMLSNVFGERYITVKIHAPGFLSANSAIDSLRGSAEWKIRLVDSLAHAPGLDIVRAEIRLQSKVNWMFYIEVAASFLFVTALIINLFRRRKDPL